MSSKPPFDTDLVRALAQIVATVSIFWGPGLLVLRLAGCRGWLRTIAAAPAATLAVFFAGSLAASHLHVRWELWSALGCTAAVAAAAFLVRRRLSTDPVPVRRRVRAASGPNLPTVRRRRRRARPFPTSRRPPLTQ